MESDMTKKNGCGCLLGIVLGILAIWGLIAGIAIIFSSCDESM